MTPTKNIPQKALIVTWNFPPKLGGMENLIQDIYNYLSSLADIRVVAPYHPDAANRAGIFRPSRDGFFFFSLFALLKGFRLARKNGIRVFYGGSLAVLPVLVVLKIVIGGRCHAFAHGLDVIYENRLYQAILSVCMPWADSLACNSSNTKRLILERFPNVSKVTVIPPGLDMKKYDAKPGRIINRRYILSVGRLTERKGLVEFIQNVFVKIAQARHDVDLVIVGAEPLQAVFHKGGYRKKILGAISKTGLENRVHLQGRVDDHDLLSYYRHCECLIFPLIPVKNDVEGFGMVATEAAAAGSPTVAFDVGGVTDSVLHMQTGILVAPNDYESMADRIIRLLDGEFSFENVDKKIAARYSWERLIQKHHKLLFE